MQMRDLPLICGLSFDNGLFPRFVRFYTLRGVTRIAVVLHTPELHEHVRQVIAAAGAKPEIWCVPPGDPDSLRDAALQNQLREELITEGWYVCADVDEFALHPYFGNLRDLRQAAEGFEADYVGGTLIDRVARDGRISAGLNPALTLDEQFPVQAEITKNVCKGQIAKVILARSHVPITAGHHFANGRQAPINLQVHHFKWIGDVLQRIANRGARQQRNGYSWYKESYDLIDAYSQTHCFAPACVPAKMHVGV